MKVTLKTIADAVGTSVATVSLALSDHPRVNDGTKARVREASLRLGYCTPRDMATKRSRRLNVGGSKLVKFLVLGQSSRQRNATALLSGLLNLPARLGLRLEIASLDTIDQTAQEDWVLNHATEVDCLLLYGPVATPLLVKLAERGMPAVGIGPVVGEPPGGDLRLRFRSVGFDEVAAARQATHALFDAGHQRIGLVSAHGTPGLYYDRWLAGFRLAHLEAKIPLDPRLVDRSGGRFLSESDSHPFFEGGGDATGFVVPDVTYVDILRLAMAQRGLPPPDQRMVVGGTTEQCLERGLSRFATISQDAERLIVTCLEQVRDTMAAAPSPWLNVILPHTVRGIEHLEAPISVEAKST